jgi:hypothetical protein
MHSFLDQWVAVVAHAGHTAFIDNYDMQQKKNTSRLALTICHKSHLLGSQFLSEKELYRRGCHKENY